MKKAMKTGAKTYTGDGMSPSKMPAAKGKGPKMAPKAAGMKAGMAAMKKGRPF